MKLKIDLPCLVDDMENSVEGRYGAAPDRIFLIDVDGKIAVRADQGPWGFKPGVEKTTKWLEERFPEIVAIAAGPLKK